MVFRMDGTNRNGVRFLWLLISLSAVGIAGAAEPSGVPLSVIWPGGGEQVAADRIRIGGHTDAGALVAVNGTPLRVYPTGAFAGTAPLAFGENRIVIRATKDGRETAVTRRVTRARPPAVLPPLPIRFDKAFGGEPSLPMELRPDDIVRVRVRGSPGHRATFRIGSGPTHHPLFPSTVGPAGMYEGSYVIRPADQFREARVTCCLWADKAAKPAAEYLLPARISVPKDGLPKVARTREDYTRLRADAVGGAPIALARADTYLSVVGRVGERIKVALTPTLAAWVSADEIASSNEPPLRYGLVRNLVVTETDGLTVVRFPLGLRVPFSIDEAPSRAALSLTLYGVENRLNWIIDRTPGGRVETIAVVPGDNQACRFDIALREGGLLGYRAWHEDTTFCLALRPMPGRSGDASRPLAGLTVLLDPGHGGPSEGTIGSTGAREKTVNLRLCELLRRHLERRGARVAMTRTDDRAVSLADRCAQSDREGDLFVSIHNNSIDLTGDPLAVRGASAYYFHPRARPAAQAVYDRMLRTDPPPPPYGLITADLYVVREVTAMPSILVECLFLSHPEDEMLVLDNAFADRYMESVAAGIVDWFVAAAETK